MNTNNLDTRILELVAQIPKGKVSTYKLVADAIGTKAYRYVGTVLAKNPNAPVIPCHRVVKSDGKVGGYFGSTDVEKAQKKIDLLISEGLAIDNGKVQNFNENRHIF